MNLLVAIAGGTCIGNRMSRLKLTHTPAELDRLCLHHAQVFAERKYRLATEPLLTPSTVVGFIIATVLSCGEYAQDESIGTILATIGVMFTLYVMVRSYRRQKARELLNSLLPAKQKLPVAPAKHGRSKNVKAGLIMVSFLFIWLLYLCYTCLVLGRY